MGYRLPLLIGLILLNALAVAWMAQSLAAVAPRLQRQRAWGVLAGVLLVLNLPLAVFFFRSFDRPLLDFSTSTLRLAFLPASAWVGTLVMFAVIAIPATLAWSAVKAVRWGLARRARSRTSTRDSAGPRHSEPGEAVGGWSQQMISRRRWVAAAPGLLLPVLYGVSAGRSSSNLLDDLEISAEIPIRIPSLPAAFEGLRVVQLSDVHVGPYVREAELAEVTERVNRLRPDVIVITGDLLDRHMESMGEAVRGLSGLKAARGKFFVLGNHDLYADRYSYGNGHRGGIEITKALAGIGVETLRNDTVHLSEGPDRLAILGLDWIVPRNSRDSFFRYDMPATRRALIQMNEAVEPHVPKILLGHHPDTFIDAQSFGISLMLAGHTHGGGQILLGTFGDYPVGVAMMRFKYLSGLYQENGCALYVNRGLGYLGVPIRFNCPPEIARFQLTRAVAPAKPAS